MLDSSLLKFECLTKNIEHMHVQQAIMHLTEITCQNENSVEHFAYWKYFFKCSAFHDLFTSRPSWYANL